MPRDLPVGNGRMLVTFDQHYQIRDLYFPHVGQENHAGHGPCRFGVFADTADGTGKLLWSSDGWSIRRRYLRDCLTTSVALEHPELGLRVYCNDAVDFHRRILVRRIKVRNLTSRPRQVRVIHHQAWHMMGTNVGNTAYFDPDLGAVVHYRAARYISAGFFDADGRPTLDGFATGTSGFGGAEGTWRDAEDGHLQGNTIAQGAVDSCIARHLTLEPDGEATCHLVFICAESREELLTLHRWLDRQTPEGVLSRTTAYWRLWVSGTAIRFGNLPPRFVDLFKRSLLIVRTQVDDSGAILAANDSDILQFSRDTYSYVWPRDGALVADSLDAAGFPMLSRRFFEFCQRTITPEGYLHHKYNPDGSLASSWHPWQTNDGQRRLPIQEDETALVVWALWRHFERHRDTEFIRPMWVDIVQPAAEFMLAYRDPATGLPLPSYDLWEERWGVHAFTVATVWAGLKAAEKFATAFGDTARADRYRRACDEIRAGADAHLYDPALGRFVRRLIPPPRVPHDTAATAPGCVRVISDIEGAVRMPASPIAPAPGSPPGSPTAADAPDKPANPYGVDEVLDASLWALGHFGMYAPEDPRLRATLDALERRLWVKTPVGGMARYERDYYHRVSTDTASVPGNPWFICTLWLADDLIARATSAAELKRALPVLEWVVNHAMESGALAEQVHPTTGEPLSVSPLTWSHAQVVSTAINYLEKLEKLSSCATCRQPLFHVRATTVAAAAGVAAAADAAEPGPAVLAPPPLETLVASASLPAADARPATTLAIDTRDCIGCGVCVNTCSHSVLVSHRGKALIDLRQVGRCDADAACVSACPTGVIRLNLANAQAA